MLTTRRLVACTLTLGLLVAACGGDDDDAGDGSDGNTPEGSESSVSGSAPAGKPIIIGMDEDSTGPGASYSTIAGDTVRDAIDELNANGGVLGRPLELVVENDESDPTKAPSIIRKLIDRGSKILILQSAGAAVEQAKPVVQQAGIVSIAPTSISQSVAEPPDADYTYVLANPISDFVEVFCGAFEAGEIEKLAVLSDDTPTIDGVNQLLLPGLKDCVDVVEEKAPVDAADLNAQVARLRDEDPDAVLVSSVGGNFEVLAQNTLFEQMNDTTRFSLASIGNQPDTWELANPGALEGLIYMASIDPTNPRTEALTELLDPLRGDDWTMTAYDAQAYDTVQLIKLAIENAGGVDDPQKLQEAMNSITDYKPHFGQESFTLSYSAKKHVGTDGLCGLSLVQFDAENRPGEPWSTYQPPCE